MPRTLTDHGNLTEPGRLRLRAFGGSLVLWAVMGLVTARGYMLLAGAGGIDVSFRQALGLSLPSWIAWAVLTIPAFELVALVPVRRPRLWARLVLHLIAVPVFVILQLALTVVVLRALQVYPTTSPFLTQLTSVARVLAAYQFLVYICLVGICHAILAYEAYRDQALLSARQGVSLAQARLHGMALRLQPESLLPVLSEIAARIRSDSASARRLISRVGELLRWSLRDIDTPRLIPLSRELVYLDLYLDVLRELHRNRLRVRLDVELEAYEVEVPAFLLQPLAQLTAGDLSWAGEEGALLEISAHRESRIVRLVVRAIAGDPTGGDLSSLVGRLESTAASLCARLRVIYSAPVSAQVQATADRLAVQLTLPARITGERSAA